MEKNLQFLLGAAAVVLAFLGGLALISWAEGTRTGGGLTAPVVCSCTCVEGAVVSEEEN